MNDKELYNMIKEHLMGIEKNTEKVASILEATKQTLVWTASAYFIVLIIQKIFT